MTKVQESVAAEQLLEKMVKEEKCQIAANMKDSDLRKAKEEEESKELEAQNSYFIQGRKNFDKLQAEAHKEAEQKAIEERKKEMARKEMERQKNVSEAKAEQDAAFKEAMKKKEALVLKVDERRKAGQVAHNTTRKE